MKIKYKLFGADPLIMEHIKRSIAFDNVDLILMARKSLENLEKSRMSHLITGDMKLITDSMKDKSRAIVDNLNEMFKLEVEADADGNPTINLFISPSYFVVGDSIESKFGRLGKRLVHFMSRQGIVDGIEKNLRQTYGIKFVGEVIDSDRKNIRTSAFL